MLLCVCSKVTDGVVLYVFVYDQTVWVFSAFECFCVSVSGRQMDMECRIRGVLVSVGHGDLIEERVDALICIVNGGPDQGVCLHSLDEFDVAVGSVVVIALPWHIVAITAVGTCLGGH